MTDQKHTKDPWWWPVETDIKWCDEIRKDYDLPADWDNETIRDEYNDGLKYSITWDHIGDAYAEYEPMVEYLLKAQPCVNALAGIDDPEAFMRDVRGAFDCDDAFDRLDHLNNIEKHLKGGAE